MATQTELLVPIPPSTTTGGGGTAVTIDATGRQVMLPQGVAISIQGNVTPAGAARPVVQVSG